MKSIKFGRGPSFLRGIRAFCLTAVGLTWTVCMIKADDVPFFFILLGIITVVIGLSQGIYDIKNALSKERYSSFDLTDNGEEADPLNKRFGKINQNKIFDIGGDKNFCPYCGSKIISGHGFCQKCGKNL